MDAFSFGAMPCTRSRSGRLSNPGTGQTEDDSCSTVTGRSRWGVLPSGDLLQSHHVGRGGLRGDHHPAQQVCPRALDRRGDACAGELRERECGALQQGVERAKEAKLVNSDEEAIEFLLKRGYGPKAQGINRRMAQRILDLIQAEEQRPARSAWDFATGITALAREELNQDTRIDLELKAKRILDKVAS
jgi:hypothetical protein